MDVWKGEGDTSGGLREEGSLGIVFDGDGVRLGFLGNIRSGAGMEFWNWMDGVWHISERSVYMSIGIIYESGIVYRTERRLLWVCTLSLAWFWRNIHVELAVHNVTTALDLSHPFQSSYPYNQVIYIILHPLKKQTSKPYCPHFYHH